MKLKGSKVILNKNLYIKQGLELLLDKYNKEISEWVTWLNRVESPKNAKYLFKCIKELRKEKEEIQRIMKDL